MTRPPEINPPPPVEASAGARIDELGNLARQFAQTAERCPAATARSTAPPPSRPFADLSQILPILYGPNPTGVQRQQLRVVTKTPARSSPPPPPPWPPSPRSTRPARRRDALQGLSRNSYYDHRSSQDARPPRTAPSSDLDASRVARHQQVVGEAVDLMSTAVNQMNDALNQRLQGRRRGDAAGAEVTEETR
jgi:hypothetical protein